MIPGPVVATEFDKDKDRLNVPYRSMKGPMLAAFLYTFTRRAETAKPETQAFRDAFTVTKKNGIDWTNALTLTEQFLGSCTPEEKKTVEDMQGVYQKFLEFGTMGSDATWGDNCLMRYSQLKAIAGIKFQNFD